MKENNSGIDKIIDKLNQESNKKYVSERVWIRPSKFKSVVGFIFSLIVLVILIGLFSFNLMYFVMLLVNILVLVFFTVNTFTKEGLSLPKTITHEVVEDSEEDVDDNTEEDTIEDTKNYNDNFYDQENNEVSYDQGEDNNRY